MDETTRAKARALLPTLGESTIRKLVHAEHGDPFSVLGAQVTTAGGEPAVSIRALWPGAARIEVVDPATGDPLEVMTPIHEAGLFEALFPGRTTIPPYRLHVKEWLGGEVRTEDPYRFDPLLSEYDLHLLSEGTHYRTWEKLGAHITRVGPVPGVHFAVWAPTARRVSVVGDFNNWDGRRHMMRKHPHPGIWEIFVPRVPPGVKYKFEVASLLGGPPALKADPHAFFFEYRPATASIVHDITGFVWNDQEWMERRKERRWLDEPMAIYEVHLGSWTRDSRDPVRRMGYRELAHRLADYALEMGYTHIELLPMAEYPYDGSWGYQPLGHFAPTSRYGTPQDFQYFIDHLHQRGIGVLIDWVPAHFPKDSHGLARFDGTALFEHLDPRLGEHMDWGSLIYNYGRNEVRNFLISSALFWIDRYHVDGLRVDAVASMLYLDYSREPGQWIPNRFGGRENLEAVEFIRQFNEVVHTEHPGVLTIAEESTAWPLVSRPTYVGGLGFDLKWNMGWMHDSLAYFSMDSIFRKFHHNKLTFSLWYAFTENFALPFSHDEVVHGKRSLLDKMPGDLPLKFANQRALMGYMIAHPGKKLLFMGIDIGQWSEWRFEDGLDWHLLEYDSHARFHRYMRDLIQLYRNEPTMWEVDFDNAGFQWIDLHNADLSVIAWMRFDRSRRRFLIFVCNFTPVPRFEYRVGVPEPGFYHEIFNSDSSLYGGQNWGNFGGVRADPAPRHDHRQSILLTLPPLGFMAFRWENDRAVETESEDPQFRGSTGPRAGPPAEASSSPSGAVRS